MSNSGINQVFVYGSLRSGFKSPAYEYISQFFNLIGLAKAKGKLVDMGHYPAGIPSTDDTYIIGELYVARNNNEFSWAIGQLDDYEGVSVEADEVQLYRRGLTDVLIDGKITQAWIYWYNGDTSHHPIIESGDLLQYLSQKK